MVVSRDILAANPMRAGVPQVASGTDTVGFVLAVGYLIGVYTNIPLPLNESLVVPAFIAGGAACLLLLHNLSRVKTAHIGWLGLYLFIAFLSLLLAPRSATFFIDRLKGYIYLVYASVGAYALYLELMKWPRDKVARLFCTFVVLILVGCFLENYLGLRLLSDAFRNAVFTRGVYDANLRDLSDYGAIRPKLFTSEPSHVAKFFALSITVWLALSRSKSKYWFLFALAGLGAALIRSPILLVALINAVAIKILLDQRGGFLRTPKGVVTTIGIAVVAVLAIGLIGATVLRGRMELIASGQVDDSVLLRLVAPIFVALHTLQQSPLWGAGISGTESIVADLARIFGQLDINIERIADTLESRVLNAFWLHWIYLGLFGGGLALWALWGFARSLGARHPLFCAGSIMLFSQTMGGYNSTRFWTFAMLIVVISAQLARDKAFRGIVWVPARDLQR